MKKITLTFIVVAFVLGAFAQSSLFRTELENESISPVIPLVASVKKSVDQKLNAQFEKPALNSTLQKLDSLYVNMDGALWGTYYFEYSNEGLNTLMSVFSDMYENGNLIETMRQEYQYSDEGLEENRKEYADEGDGLQKVSDINYFYSNNDLLDSMSIMMLIEGSNMQIEADIVYKGADQISSTIMFADIFGSGNLERVHQIDYYYSNQMLDSIFERTLGGDLSFNWAATTVYDYNENDLIEEVMFINESNSEKHNFSYTSENVLEAVDYSYLESDTWYNFSREEINYSSNEDIISPIFFDDLEVNYYDFGIISEMELYSHDGADWYADGNVDFYYSGLGTGLLGKKFENNFSMYPNPTNGSISFNFAELGMHQVNILDMSGKLILSESIGAQQSLDLSTLENGYYFVQVVQNGINLGAKKLVKQ